MEGISSLPPERPKYGPIIEDLSISTPGKSCTVVVTATAHSEDGLNIEKAEWWIGDDPGRGKGHSMEAVGRSFKSSRVDITVSIDISDFKPGSYQISVRSADVRGVWGSPQGITLIVPAKETRPPEDKPIGEETKPGDAKDILGELPPEPLPLPDRHGLRNAIISILIAAGLFIGYKIISNERGKAQLSISTSPSGASLIIDGKNIGQTPKTNIWLHSGKHHIVLEKEGYLRNEQEISVDPGEKKVLKVTLSQKSLPPDPTRLEAEINKALRGKGLKDVYVEVNKDLTANFHGFVDRVEDKAIVFVDIARLYKDLKEVRDNVQVKPLQTYPMPDGTGERKRRAEELVVKGKSSQQAGNFEEAINFLNLAMTLYPDHPGINEMIVSLQAKIREERRWKRAEEFVNKGKSSEQSGNFEEALDFYMEARRIYPNLSGINEVINAVRAKILPPKGNNQISIEEDLKEAIAAFNNFQYDVVIKMCQSILRKDPNNRTAQQYLQKAKEEQEKAINDLLKKPSSVKKIQ